MIELVNDMGGRLLAGEPGSRKAQAFLLGLAGVALAPEASWQILGLTGAYILGRAWHDAALARSSGA